MLYLVRSKPPVLALSVPLLSIELSALKVGTGTRKGAGTGTGTRTETGTGIADDIVIFPLGDRGVPGAGRGEVRR